MPSSCTVCLSTITIIIFVYYIAATVMAEDLASELTSDLADRMFALFQQGSTREEAIKLLSNTVQKINESNRKERLTAESRMKDNVLGCKLAPSSITWYNIQDSGMVPTFEGFIMDINNLEVKQEIPMLTDTEMLRKATSVRDVTVH